MTRRQTHPAAFFDFSIGSIIAYMRNGWKSIGSIIGGQEVENSREAGGPSCRFF